MKQVTVKDILEITGGTLLCGDETYEIINFSTDSRNMGEGKLFVPLIGERVDAHNFIESALKNGGATLTEKHSKASDVYPWIRVENTMEAMQKIATWYRNQMPFPMIAVTGSVGKTTTREMITRALEGGFTVFHTEGNYNSQVGVPLTIARMTGEEEVAVLEAGMSQFDEMAELEKMIQPNVVVFTNIGVAHIENLGTQDNICTEKMQLAKNVGENGIVVLNGDDPILMKHKEEFLANIITYGTSKECDYQAKDIRTEQGQTKFTCVRNGKEIPIVMDVLGHHNVLNALAAFAVAEFLGLPIEKVAHQFENFKGTRQQIHILENYTIIDDTYNASPDSMKASLRVLSDMESDGKKIAVLADMLELGEKSIEYHKEVGAFLGKQSIDCLYVLGELSTHLLEEAKMTNRKLTGAAFDTREELTKQLERVISKGDCILLKGSNGMKLSEVAKHLLK